MRSHFSHDLTNPDIDLVYFTPTKSDALFPYAIVGAGHSRFGPNHPVVSKCYRHHTFIFTLSGCGTVKTKQRTHQAGPSSVTWLDTSLAYAHGCSANSDHWAYLWIAVSGIGLDDLHADILRKGPPVFQVNPALEATFSDVFRHISGPKPKKGVGSSALVAGLVATLLDDTGDESGGLSAVLSQVRNNLGRKWTVASMADLASISGPHFHRVFKRNLGLSPIEWLRYERINAAKYLLSQTDLRVAEIGRRCGYDDPYNFSREFARLVGTPPSHFRKFVRS